MPNDAIAAHNVATLAQREQVLWKISAMVSPTRCPQCGLKPPGLQIIGWRHILEDDRPFDVYQNELGELGYICHNCNPHKAIPEGWQEISWAVAWEWAEKEKIEEMASRASWRRMFEGKG